MSVDEPADVHAGALVYVPLSTPEYVPVSTSHDGPSYAEGTHDDLHRATEFPDWLHGDRVADESAAASRDATEVSGDGRAVSAPDGFGSGAVSADAMHGGVSQGVGAAGVENPAVHLARIGEELWA